MARWAPGGRSRCAALAALAYLLLAGWWMRDVLPDPGGSVLGVPRESKSARVIDSDQLMVISVIGRHARMLATDPTVLARDGSCFPLPASYTLGDHMFGNALLAALPLALSDQPIFAYNVLLLLNVWIAALAMYALSVYFTRSPPAAFVAGLLFAFEPMRLADLVHPYVSGGDAWAPLALLFLHRLFAEGSWRGALGFAFFSSLLVGESLYALLSSSMLVAVLGISLVAREPRRLRALASKLCVAGGLIGLVAWLVLGPYLTTARTWGMMHRTNPIFALPLGFALHARFFPGIVVLALAVLALLDRARGARRARGYDPRLVLLGAGLLVVLSSTSGVPLFGLTIPSPLLHLRTVVPGLDAVRVPAAIRIGGYLVAAFLAGYGVLAIIETLGKRARVVVAGAIAVLALLEVGLPAFATFSFGAPPARNVRSIRPDASDVELATRVAEGAVLDLPNRWIFLMPNAEALLLSIYHRRPTSACYNSFVTPIQAQVESRAWLVPSPQPTEELAALGFRTLLVHRKYQGWGGNLRQPEEIAHAAARPGGQLTALGSSSGIDAYRLAAPAELHSDLAALAPGGPGTDVSSDERTVAPPRAKLSFPIGNSRDATFVHPKPFVPSALVVAWRKQAGGDEIVEQVRALLPLAIASHATNDLELELRVPELPGRYEVVVARASDPGTPLARSAIRVTGDDPS